MLAYNVALTQDTETDLEAIYDYIAEYDCPENGSIPKELLDLGNRDYCQTLFNSYRLIYKIIDQQIVIFLITDGRRDMQALLTQHLLR
ncbi:type II toxin-antitoxin system RelE/ParE family toxin [Gilliamella sp. W8145]|uniref:type II toxin-antitoxin system RelE/ParE family toxin n=1 Tax=Gilliamella sp. W8145 TaxID=2750990 RepID=UPI0018DBD417|nr:type II toxin-antitoxin system RelE/ParE family toxin [Gilliamella sp. W8145]MBI0103568.1 type II toxin-antitoxin system RelE/ParE family toxin [Gilliamella sp. W8145]